MKSKQEVNKGRNMYKKLVFFCCMIIGTTYNNSNGAIKKKKQPIFYSVDTLEATAYVYSQRKKDFYIRLLGSSSIPGLKTSNISTKQYQTPPHGQPFKYPINGKKWCDFQPGVMQKTTNPLDIGTTSEGFFMLEDGTFTKNGSLKIENGILLNTTYNLPILSKNNSIISIPGNTSITSIEISSDGTIIQKPGNQIIDQIGVFEIDKENYDPLEDGRFKSQAIKTIDDPQIQAGFLEASTLNHQKIVTNITEETQRMKITLSMIKNKNDDRSNAVQSIFG
jgi:flagellar basal body rod protein FlgF